MKDPKLDQLKKLFEENERKKESAKRLKEYQSQREVSKWLKRRLKQR